MMKQILKRTGALLLTLCLTLSVWGAAVPFSASAQNNTIIVVGGSTKEDAEEIDFSIEYGVILSKQETRWFKFTTYDSNDYWYNLSVKDITVGNHNGFSGINGKIVDFFDEQYSSCGSFNNSTGVDGAKLNGSTVYYVAIYGHNAGNIKFQLNAEYDEFGETMEKATSVDFDTSYKSRINSNGSREDNRIGDGLNGDVDYIKFYTEENTKFRFTLTNVDIAYYNSYYEGCAGIVQDNLEQQYGYLEVRPNGEKSIELELEENTYYYIKLFATSGEMGHYSFKIESIQSEPQNSELTDDTTGIVVEGTAETLPDDAVLNAKQTASGEDTATYEITLTQNGQTVQPTGEVTVKIPLPESMRDKNIAVYRIEADGSRTDMNATVQNGYVVFVTDHFSQYLLEAKIMPADYTAVDAALAKVPEDLSGYTDETAQAVKDAVAAVERDLPITEQAKVNAMAKAIEDAVAALKKAEKPAVLGDIDGDGKVSVTDALAILRMAVGLSTPVDNADIDGMNGVTVTDALAALRIAVGLA